MRATPCSEMHSSAVSPPGWCSDAARPLRWLHRDAMCQEPAIVRQRRAVRPRKPRCGHVVSMHFHAGARTLDERFCRAAALGSMWGWAGDCACEDVVGRRMGWWAMGDGVEAWGLLWLLVGGQTLSATHLQDHFDVHFLTCARQMSDAVVEINWNGKGAALCALTFSCSLPDCSVLRCPNAWAS